MNCLIYRLDKERSFLEGRSFCPNCKKILKWQDLIPILSFLFLKGKCRHCKEKISWQYPLVEISAGVIFLLIFNYQSSIINLIFLFYIASSLIIIFTYDLRYYIIPDKVVIPAIITTLIYHLTDQPLLFNFLGAAAMASGFFFLIFVVSRGQWMGFGDVKLAFLMGLLLGISNVLLALFSAFFFGAVAGLLLMVLRNKSLKSEIPFAPFLIAGTFVALLWGQQIVQWYLNFFQI